MLRGSVLARLLSERSIRTCLETLTWSLKVEVAELSSSAAAIQEGATAVHEDVNMNQSTEEGEQP